MCVQLARRVLQAPNTQGCGGSDTVTAEPDNGVSAFLAFVVFMELACHMAYLESLQLLLGNLRVKVGALKNKFLF